MVVLAVQGSPLDRAFEVSSLATSRFACKIERLTDNSAKERRISMRRPLVQQPLNSQANTGVLLSLLAGSKWLSVKTKSPNS